MLNLIQSIFVIGAAGFLLALVYLRRPPAPLWPSLLGLPLLALVFGLGQLGESLYPGPSEIHVLWRSLSYSGLIFLGATWWLVSLRLAELEHVPLPSQARARAGTRAALVAAGALWVLMLTNPWHGQFLTYRYGAPTSHHWGWWLAVVFSYSLALASGRVLAGIRAHARNASARARASVLLGAGTVVLVANVIHVLGLSPVNLTAGALAIAGCLVITSVHWMDFLIRPREVHETRAIASRLRQTAIAIGLGAMAVILVATLPAYRSIEDAHVREVLKDEEHLLRQIRTHAEVARGDEANAAAVRAWEESDLSRKYCGAFLSLVGDDGSFQIHAATIPAAGSRTGPDSARDAAQGELARRGRLMSDWSGRFVTSDGAEWLGAFVRIEALRMSVGVHVPRVDIDEGVLEGGARELAALALCAIALIPLALGFLHRAASVAQGELVEAQSMLRTVLDSIPVRVFWKDRDSVYLGCNDLLAEDAGFDHPGKIEGSDDFAMPWAGKAQHYRENDRAVIESGEPTIGCEAKQVRPDGNRAWIRLSKLPLRRSDGEIIGVLGTYEDITEAKRANEDLEQRLRLEALIAELATKFVALPAVRIDDEIRRALQRVMEFNEDEFSLVFAIPESEKKGRVTHMGWTSSVSVRAQAFRARLAGFDLRDLGRTWQLLEQGRLIHEPSLASLPPSAPARRVVFEDSGVVSGLILPLVDEGRLAAVLSFGTFRREKSWSESSIALLKVLGEIVSSALRRKRADAALRSSQRQLDKAQEIAGLGHWKLNLTTDQLTWSDGLYRIAGVEPGTFGPSREAAVALVHPEDRTALFGAEALAETQQEVRHLELRIIRPDGAERWLSLHIEPFETGDGEHQIIGVAHDITEQKRTELLLRQRLDFGRVLITLATEFVNLPPAQIEDGINRALRAVIEHTGDDIAYLFDFAGGAGSITHEAVGPAVHSRRKMLAGFALESVPEALARLRRGELVHLPSLTALPPDTPGREAFIEQTGVQAVLSLPIMRNGELAAVIGFASAFGEKRWSGEEITILQVLGEIVSNALERRRSEAERMRLEGQLRQSQKMEAIGTLAGGVAHDFNNILAVILANAELASKGLESGETQESLMRIVTAAERASDIVSRILSFSRKSESTGAPLDAREAVEETLDIARAALAPSIGIRFDADDEALMIEVDRSEIHAAIMNLCVNAAQAMTDGGIVSVGLRRVHRAATPDMQSDQQSLRPCAEITVRDTGKGIPPEVINRIYEPYFTTKPRGDGTGMGLSVVHGVVSAAGGEIEVESTPGAGTVFRLYFPLHEARASVQDVSAPTPYEGREHVLLVEDDPDVRAAVRRILEASRYTVSECGNGEEALQTLQWDPTRFALVVADRTMPRLGGIALAMEIERTGIGIPVLLITGFADEETLDAARAVGIATVVRKPFKARQLLAAIRFALSRETPGG